MPDQGINESSGNDVQQLKQNLRNRATPSQPGAVYEPKVSNNDVSQLRARTSQPAGGAIHEQTASNDSVSRLKSNLRDRATASQPGAVYEETAPDEYLGDMNYIVSQPEPEAVNIQTAQTALYAVPEEFVPKKESFEEQKDVENGTNVVSSVLEPVTTSKKSKMQQICGQRTRCISSIFICLLLFALVIALPVVLIGKRNEMIESKELEAAPSSTPTLAPSSIPSSAPSTFFKGVVTSSLASAFGDEYATSQTASRLAAREWTEDDLSTSGLLQDDAELSAAEEERMIERYLYSLLYFSLGGEEWSERLDFLSEKDACDWNDGEKGLFCGDDGIVTKIDIVNNGLSQTIPSEIGALSSLKSINLKRNAIGGRIPYELGDLENIEYIEIDGNKITGTIPTTIGMLTNALLFSIDDNKIGGTIPSDIGNLVNVREINLARNKLTGTIPSDFGNLNELAKCYLKDNKLTGTVPPELLALPSLMVLRLEMNDIGGDITICDVPDLGADCKGMNNIGGNAEVACGYQCCSWCCSKDGSRCSVNEP